MRTPVYAGVFKKDYKRCQKRGYAMQELIRVMSDIESEIPLQPRHREHTLQGDYAGSLECHITSDWLLIYQIESLY